MNIVVTGANGYIGRCLIARARREGHVVFAAARQDPFIPGVPWLRYELYNPSDLAFPVGVDAIVHLAARTRPEPGDAEREIASTIALFKRAKATGIRFVFVSSQAAAPGAPTTYGKVKFEIERALIGQGGVVIRTGLVYGGGEKGLFGELVQSVRHMPCLPVMWPSPLVQPVHVDDLASALIACCLLPDVDRVFCVAQPEPITFTEFLRSIARLRVHRHRFFLPIPYRLVACAIALAGNAIRQRFGLSRLKSLYALPILESATDLELLGVRCRPISEGMPRSGNGRRRLLLLEARCMLSYLLTPPPTISMCKRYTRAIEQLRNGTLLGLPTFILNWPILLFLLDKNVTPCGWLNEVKWRLNAGLIISEASIEGYYQYLTDGRSHSRLGTLCRLALICTWAGISMMCCLIMRPFIYMAIKEKI